MKIRPILFLLLFLGFSGVVSAKKKPSPDALKQAKILKDMFSVGGLFGKAMPSKGRVHVELESEPLPAEIQSSQRKTVFTEFSRAFYLKESFGEGQVEFDRKVLPNYPFLKLDIDWQSVKTVSGKEVFSGGAKKAISEFSDRTEIAVKELNEEDPLFVAQGKAQASLPVRFIRMDLNAGGLGKPVSAGDFSGKLLMLQNDYYEILLENLKGKDIGEANPVVAVFGDEGRLKVTEHSRQPADIKMPDFIARAIADLESGKMTAAELGPYMEKHQQTDKEQFPRAILSGKAAGVVTRISIFIPVETVTETFTVTATAEPSSNPEKNIPAAAPRYLHRQKTEYRSFTRAELEKSIRIYADRTSAIFGYNNPEVVCALPKIANSSYASIEFAEPVLLNAKGGKVGFTLEHSGFINDKYSSEIRFTPKTGDKPPVFAKAKGKIIVRYPIRIQTIRLKKSASDKKQVIFNNQFVKYDKSLAGESGDSFEKTIRAYDASGRELQRLNYAEITVEENGEFETLGFWGIPEVVEVDKIEEWAELSLDYNLPPAPLLPTNK